jgi:hypothetical protein
MPGNHANLYRDQFCVFLPKKAPRRRTVFLPLVLAGSDPEATIPLE